MTTPTTTQVTAALPTWQSAHIIWLQLEALCRQETSVPWELIVHECEDDAAREVVGAYEDALRRAGCESVRYQHNPERVPLGLKWKQIAEQAKGTCLILAASDNYSPPDRIQRAHEVINEQGYDWTDTSRGVFYDIPTGKQATWTRRRSTASGLWMACKTEHIRSLKGEPPDRAIDGWIKGQLPEGFSWHQEEEAHGVHTDGANTISHTRRNLYIRGELRPPFIPATQDALEIIPKELHEPTRAVRPGRASAPIKDRRFDGVLSEVPGDRSALRSRSLSRDAGRDVLQRDHGEGEPGDGGGSEGLRLAILTCLWKRSRLSRLVLERIAGLEVPGVDLVRVAVYSPEDDERGGMCDVQGWQFVAHPNEPVSDKWNAGARYLRHFDVDAMMIVGSDDFINGRLVECVVEKLKEGAKYVVPQTLYFYDTSSKKAMYCRASKVGAGLTITRDLLERLGFRPWKSGVNKGIDGAMYKRLREIGIQYPETVREIRDEGAVLLDVKTAVNNFAYPAMERGLSHEKLDGPELLRELVPEYAEEIIAWT